MNPSISFPHNPFLPGKMHIPDGEPRVFGDRLYVYGSHDVVGTDRYCAGSYVGWSAPLSDLGDWRFEGEILAKGEDPMDPDGDKDYYAPDCVQGPDGRYYLYYSIEGSMVISVAVCDEPAGRFHFYGHVKDESGHVLGSAPGDDFQFDPAVLADDDGRYYLYSGQGMPLKEMEGRRIKGSMVCELAPDMVTAITPQRVITSPFENRFEENPFFEASSIRKVDGKYVFIYSPLPNNHFLCYATSDYPDRDYNYRGVLVSNVDIFPGDPTRQLPVNYWGNNHGSLVEMNGEWYIFYHRNTNRSPYARQACAEKITRTADGGFAQAEITSQGLYGKPLPARGTFPARLAFELHAKEQKPIIPFTFLEYADDDPWIKDDPEEEEPYITNLCDGGCAGFRYFAFDGTQKEVRLTVRGTGEGRWILTIRGGDMEERAETPAPASKNWNEIIINIPEIKGTRTLILKYEGDGCADVKEMTIR